MHNVLQKLKTINLEYDTFRMKYISYAEPYDSESVCFMYKKAPPLPQVKRVHERRCHWIERHDLSKTACQETNLKRVLCTVKTIAQ